jgi:transcriptional regulator
MYIPPPNRVGDPSRIRAFIQSHGFATIVTQSGGSMRASHLPLLLDESPDGDSLRGHMAIANEQWRLFNPEEEVFCIFSGPHSYISPSWYEKSPSVPTWNYAVVHAHGRPTIEADPGFMRRVLRDTTEKYESKMPVPWNMDGLPEDYVSRMTKAIVAFSIRITRIEAKFKLGQDRSAGDKAGVMRALENSGDPESRMLAGFARQQEGNPA